MSILGHYSGQSPDGRERIIAVVHGTATSADGPTAMAVLALCDGSGTLLVEQWRPDGARDPMYWTRSPREAARRAWRLARDRIGRPEWARSGPGPIEIAPAGVRSAVRETSDTARGASSRARKERTTMETPATADSPTTAAPSPRVRIARLTAYRRSDALAALTEACRPYGSLSAEVPALMLDWACGTRRAGYPPGAESLCEEINCDDPHRLDVASLLLAAIRGVDTSESSDLTLGDFTAAVCTPTSGTVIGVRRFAGGVDVTVDFGPDGSARRGADLVASKRWQIEYVDPAATARVSIR